MQPLLIILILCIILVICYVILYSLPYKKVGDVGNWSKSQKAIIYDKIVTIFITNPLIMQNTMFKTMNCQGYKAVDIIHCIVNALEKKLNFNNANTNITQYINADPTNPFMNSTDVIQCLINNCPGIPATPVPVWTSMQKQILTDNINSIYNFKPSPITNPCVSCLVQSITINIDPTDPNVQPLLQTYSSGATSSALLNPFMNILTKSCAGSCLAIPFNGWTIPQLTTLDNNIKRLIGVTSPQPMLCDICMVQQISSSILPTDPNVQPLLSSNPPTDALHPFINILAPCNNVPCTPSASKGR